MTDANSTRICIVEDDPDTRALIRTELESLNFHTIEYRTGLEALAGLTDDPCALVILDIGLPDIDGFEVCRRLRAAQSEVPIIFLTSRAEEIDRVSGFALGADDYVTKPFSPRELGFRIKALLRRIRGAGQSGTGAPSVGGADANAPVAGVTVRGAEEPMSFGPLSIWTEKRRVTYQEKVLSLTALEFDLLIFLALNPGRPFTRDELMEQVWGFHSTQYGSTVTTLLNRLRKKIEPDVANPSFVLTVYGVGYRFVDPAVDELPK